MAPPAVVGVAEAPFVPCTLHFAHGAVLLTGVCCCLYAVVAPDALQAGFLLVTLLVQCLM